ncbi:MAG: alpha-hydroxy acid oxidase [Acidimicrobiales bacterium]
MELGRLRQLLAPGLRGVAALPTVDDHRRAARRRLPAMVFDFIDGGADGELAVAANRAALDRVLFTPEYLVDVAERDLSTTVFDRPVSLPLILSPSGLATLAHPEGELAVARAAADAGVIFAVSTASGYPLEEIADVAATKSDSRLWFQLYLWKSEDVVRSLIDRAAAAGYEALVVTIDVPVVGKRERDLRNGMSLPVRVRPAAIGDAVRHLPWLCRMLQGPEITFANLTELAPGDSASAIGEYTSRELTDPARTWDDLALIRRRWDGPLLVKGVMGVGDAKAAVAAGADGLIVSNHGGRQLSSVPGVADVVPAVADAVGDRAEIFLDGGVRRGEDIVKARALGATAACGGRLWYWPLAAGGEAGVRSVLSILEADVDRTLALVGRRRYDDVDRSLLHPG